MRKFVKFKTSLVFLLGCLIILGCEITTTLEGVWLGGGVEYDEDTYRPILTLYSFDKDKLIATRIDSTPDTITYQQYDDRLIVGLSDTFSYKINGQILEWGNGSKEFYHKLENINLSLDEVRSNISNKFWKGEKETISYDNNGSFLAYLENDKYNQYCYKLIAFESKVFLLKYGNHLECLDYYQYMEQVVDIDDSMLKIIRWEEDQFKEIVYTSIDYKLPAGTELQPSDFQLCNKYLNSNDPIDRYYSAGTAYKGGIYKIGKELSKKYVPPIDKESGIIRIRFVVNCQGKTGHFEMIELDENYIEKEFASNIPEQLYSFTKDLNDWIPGRIQGREVDSYKFITYKITNGEITEIFP